MTPTIKIQTSRTAQGVTIKIDTNVALSSISVYETKDAPPTTLKETVSGTARSVSYAVPAVAGVYFYKVTGVFAGSTITSNTDFMLCDSSIGYRRELKTAIYQNLLLNSALTALVSTQIYAGFPQTLTTYPAVIFWLDELSMPDEARQHYEGITLRVKAFARSQATLDAVCDAINQAMLDYSYEGKEAVIYSTKKFSETGTQLEGDGQTLSVDMFFRLTTERVTVPTIL